MTTEITLDWHGPFKPSDVGAEDQKKLEEKLRDIGQSVYASYYEISDNQFALYFGYSKDVHARILQHCRMTLGGFYIVPCKDKNEGTFKKKTDKNKEFKHQLDRFDRLTNENIEANKKFFDKTAYYFAEIKNENLDKVNNPKELASDIERALILKYKEICNDRSECISNNTGLQGCKSAKNTDFKIKMSGADKIKNIFKDQTIYRCSRQRTKRRP